MDNKIKQVAELLRKELLVGIITGTDSFVLISAIESINASKIRTANIQQDSVTAIFKPESYDEFVLNNEIRPEWISHLKAADGEAIIICKTNSLIYNIITEYEKSYGIPVLLCAKLNNKHPTKHTAPVSTEDTEKFIEYNRIESFVSFANNIIDIELGPQIGSGGEYHPNGKIN